MMVASDPYGMKAMGKIAKDYRTPIVGIRARNNKEMILPFPISVNKAYATNWKTKRRFRSKAYGKWHQAAQDALWGQSVPEWCNGPIKLELALCKPLNKDGSITKRRMDLSNRIKVVEDFLVDMKIIEDDSQVEHLTVFWAQGFEGVKITITPLEPQA